MSAMRKKQIVLTTLEFDHSKLRQYPHATRITYTTEAPVHIDILSILVIKVLPLLKHILRGTPPQIACLHAELEAVSMPGESNFYGAI